MCVCVCVCVCKIWKIVKKKKIPLQPDPHGLQPPRDCSPPGPRSVGFPGKNPGVGCHFFSRDPPDSGIQPASPASPALAGGFFTTELLSYWGVKKLMTEVAFFFFFKKIIQGLGDLKTF